MSVSLRQCSLFDAGPRVLAEDGEGGIVYHPGVIDAELAQRWFDALREEIPWQAQKRPMYDRVVDVPRLTASFRLDSPELPPALREAAAVAQAHTDARFNAVGLNYYRDGHDSVAPHNDRLRMLTPHRPIAVLSLGEPRRMTIRLKQPPRLPIYVNLEPGSLLVMSYDSQLHYEHGVPKTREDVGARISLAFRARADLDPHP